MGLQEWHNLDKERKRRIKETENRGRRDLRGKKKEERRKKGELKDEEKNHIWKFYLGKGN